MLEDMKMLTNDATILKIKHEVNYEVAKLAFDGTFEEKKDEIPFKMIPGLRPKFRCCVYKERSSRDYQTENTPCRRSVS